MARETKIGLLLGLGVVFLFMCILQWRFGGRAHAELGAANTGSAVDVTRASQGAGTACGTDLACSGGGSAVAPESTLTIADLHKGLRGRDEDAGLMTTASDSGTVAAPVAPEHPETAGGPAPRPGTAMDVPETGTPATTLEPGTVAYTVKPGDSFSKIAKAQGVKLQDIAKLNPGVESTKMKTGMKLVLPAKATDTALVAPRDSGALPLGNVSTPAGQKTYIVAAGDSLGSISTKMYGTCKKAALIASANKGINPNSLKVGTKLVIPAAPAAATSPSAPTVAPSSAPAPMDTDPMMAVAPRARSTTPMTHGSAPAARSVEPLVDPSAYPDHIDVHSAAPAPSPTVASGPAELATPGPATRTQPRTARTAPTAPTTTPDLMGPPAPSEGMAYRETPTADATPHTLAAADTYKVQATDSLYTISKKTLGSASRWKEIYDLNRDKLPSPKALAVGQELRIPSSTRTVAATSVFPMDVVR